MNAAEMLTFIEPYFKKPVCKEWKPCEYDMKYRFKNTPAGIRKLNATKAKEDAKLLAEYQKQMCIYNKAVETIEMINLLPSAIRDLFYHTIEWNVTEGNRLREEARNLEKAAREKYGVRKEGDYRSPLFSIGEYGINRYFKAKYDEVEKKSHWVFVSEDLKKHCERNYVGIEEGEALDVFVEDMSRYIRAKKAAAGFPLAYDAIVYATNKLLEILDVMRKLLDGTPEWVEREASWGVGGHYNGIIGRGNKRVSMKSFLAGGYNIQRLHIRCKCTLLKEVA